MVHRENNSLLVNPSTPQWGVAIQGRYNVNKREIVQMLVDTDNNLPYIPSAFFLHFDQQNHRGQAAIDKHLEYFRYTDMDFVKIQYELCFSTNQPEITKT